MEDAAPNRPPDSRVDRRFRYVRRIAVRFRDLDVLGHVNHVVYLTYVEQVRTQYFYEIAGIGVPSGLPWAWVIARVACDYLQPLAFGEEVDVGWRIGRLGRASANYEFELVRGGEVVGRGDGVLVNADPRVGRSAPIPDAWRTAIAAFEQIEPFTGPR